MKVLQQIMRIVFPLLPFLIGALIRAIHNGLTMQVFNPPELTFSMALLCMICFQDASLLSNKVLGSSLASLFSILMVFFIVMFAVSLFIQIDTATALSEVAVKVQDALGAGSTFSPQEFPNHINKTQKTFDVIRRIAIWSSLFVGIGILVTSVRYGLLEKQP